VFEILKLLPKTNCRKCGQPTCILFAAMVAQGVKAPDACPPLKEENRMKIDKYMSVFRFDS
jgi:ArsR family metal-binding transcriptional regulator